MNRRRFIGLLIIFLGAISSWPAMVSANELATHAILTLKATEKSNLQLDSTLLRDLGLDPKQQLGGILVPDNNLSYFDFTASTLYAREAKEFSRDYMPNSAGKGHEYRQFNYEGWMMRGAIREDDVGYLVIPLGPFSSAVIRLGKNPYDDPGPSNDLSDETKFTHDITRVLHHFFDPALNRPLSAEEGVSGYGVSAVLTGLTLEDGLPPQKALDWAIGTQNALLSNNTPNQEHRNHFTLFTARESMFRALTGKTKLNKHAGLGEFRATEQDRLAYWATVFRSLGDASHLLQDMAQPQHTRNDAHPPTPRFFSQLLPLQQYEWYIEAAIAQETIGGYEVVLDGALDKFSWSYKTTKFPTLNFDGYPIPKFEKYSDFWTTSASDGSTSAGLENVNNGKGLADYSNRGFFSAGTNLGENPYHYPPNNPHQSYKVTIVPIDQSDVLQAGLAYTVPDRTEGGRPEELVITSESVMTAFLSTEQHYKLSLFNMREMASALVPRAVAYSAGLINYFFRGRLEIAPPANGVYAVIDDGQPHQRAFDGIARTGSFNSNPIFGFNKLRLQLRNATPNGEAMANGTVYAVVKYHVNACYDPHLTGEYRRVNQVDTLPECGSLEKEFWGGEEKIAVSEPIVMAVDPSYKTLEFTFTDANVLPVNAHSLYLQVVYRGILGQEDDAVAVATLDIHEPSYFMISNDTDYQCLDDTFYSKSAVITIIENELKASAILGTPQSPTLDRITLAGGNLQSFTYDKLDFVVGGSAGVPVSLRQPLAPASYLRLAVLGGNTGTKFGSFSASVTLNGKATSVPLDNDNGFVIYPHRVALAWGDNPRVTDHLGQFRGAYFKANYHLKTPDVNCTIAGGAAYNPEQEMQFGNFAEGDLLPKSVEVRSVP